MAIAGELAARGIDRASTDTALAEFGAAEQLQAATLLAFRFYSRQREDLGYRQVLDRIGAKLLRRGFPTAIVRAACRSLVTGAAGPTED
jgi:SOS response regulatory protein OraA/RecX